MLNLADCSPCSSGSVAPLPGTPECTICSTGKSVISSIAYCADCPIGYYSSQYGLTSCISCPAGRFGNSIGLSNSLCSGVCPAGYYCSIASSNSTQFLCPVGYFCPSGTASATQYPCNAAYYCPAGTCSATQCVCVAGYYCPIGTLFATQFPCPAGFRCPIGTSSDTQFPCAAGSWSAAGSVSCMPCPLGRASSSSGAANCQLCGLGTFARTNGSLICENCASGRYAGDIGTILCSACPAGRASTLLGIVSCPQCSPGTFAVGNGSLTCDNCAPGRYSSELGAIYCTACAPGRSMSGSGNANCPLCSVGSYADGNASVTCYGCSPGRYASEFGSVSCLSCPPSTASSNNFSTSCGRCPDPFVPINAGTACSQSPCVGGQGDDLRGNCYICEPNTFSPGGGASCQPCPANSYAPVRGAFRCISCIGAVGYICPGGRAIVEPGHWGYLIVNRGGSSNIFNNQTIGVTGSIELRTATCPVGVCIGGQSLGLAASIDPNAILNEAIGAGGDEYRIGSSNVINQAQIGESCAPSRDPSPDNTLCGKCLPCKTLWNGECVDCPDTKAGLVVTLIIFTFIYVGVLHVLSQSSSSDVKILVAFVQTAIFQLGPFDKYLAWIGFLNFTPTQSSGSTCVAPLNPYETLAMNALIPLFFLIELFLIMVVHRIWFIFSARKRQTAGIERQVELTSVYLEGAFQSPEASSPQGFAYGPYKRTAIGLMIFGYLQIATASLRYLKCVNVNGVLVLFYNPAIECSTAIYKKWLGLVIVLIILVVCGFPLLVSGFLYKRLAKIKSGSLKFIKSYGILFESYASYAWFWQPLVLVRQVLLIVLEVVFQSDHAAKYLAFCYFNLAVFCMTVFVNPNVRPHDNRMEAITHLLLIIMTAMLTGTKPPYPDGEQIFIVFLIVPFAALLTIFILIPKVSLPVAIRLGLRDAQVNKLPPDNTAVRYSMNTAKDGGRDLSHTHQKQHSLSHSNNPVLTVHHEEY